MNDLDEKIESNEADLKMMSHIVDRCNERADQIIRENEDYLFQKTLVYAEDIK